MVYLVITFLFSTDFSHEVASDLKLLEFLISRQFYIPSTVTVWRLTNSHMLQTIVRLILIFYNLIVIYLIFLKFSLLEMREAIPQSQVLYNAHTKWKSKLFIINDCRLGECQPPSEATQYKACCCMPHIWLIQMLTKCLSQQQGSLVVYTQTERFCSSCVDILQLPDYEKERVEISPGTDDFIKAFDDLVDFIVLSVSKMPRLESLLFQGSYLATLSSFHTPFSVPVSQAVHF